jgi:hypothetical protein
MNEVLSDEVTSVQTDGGGKKITEFQEEMLVSHSSNGETLSEFYSRTRLDKQRRLFLEELRDKVVQQTEDIQQVQETPIQHEMEIV